MSMNRLSEEIMKREYTMHLVDEFNDDERKDWNDLWLYNAIQVSIRKGR